MYSLFSTFTYIIIQNLTVSDILDRSFFSLYITILKKFQYFIL